MKFVLFLVLACSGMNCTQQVNEIGKPNSFCVLEFSYSDNYDEILSFRVDSSRLFLISKNDTLRYGILPDSIFHNLSVWQADILKKRKEYDDVDCENCSELVFQVIKNNDTLGFRSQNKPDMGTKRIISSIRLYLKKIEVENSGNTSFKTRGLIKPKPPSLYPLRFQMP